ncbi:MAG: hypothetical protein L6R39_003834 [Caloplaca ligustica]|nr:MAG: hypothetical protein L6R39_003834 [Caloplaca ligustica]
MRRDHMIRGVDTSVGTPNAKKAEAFAHLGAAYLIAAIMVSFRKKLALRAIESR